MWRQVKTQEANSTTGERNCSFNFNLNLYIPFRFWFIKLLMLLALSIAAFYIPHGEFSRVWYYFGLIGGFCFILIQVIFINFNWIWIFIDDVTACVARRFRALYKWSVSDKDWRIRLAKMLDYFTCYHSYY